MNKEFLDPNTKYSDQKVDLAKMPGVLQEINTLLEEIDDNFGDIQDTLDTTDATAGQVLKVETPGEAPVWGEAGPSLKSTHISKSLTSAQTNQLVRGEVAYVYVSSQIGVRGDRAFFTGSRNTAEPIKTVSGTSGGETVSKHIIFHKFMSYNPNQPNLLTVGFEASLLYADEKDANWTHSGNGPSEDFYIGYFA